jgi:hypothetical protein
MAPAAVENRHTTERLTQSFGSSSSAATGERRKKTARALRISTEALFPEIARRHRDAQNLDTFSLFDVANESVFVLELVVL